MDVQSIVQKAGTYALDNIPVGGGSEYGEAILQIFEGNRGKYYSGKMIKALFAEAGVELKTPSNTLAQLFKADKLARPKNGWYVAK